MDDLAERFVDFARAFRSAAPLYSRLASHTASRPEILDVMDSASPTQRLPVLLFASVHFLLLRNSDHALAHHFPNLNKSSLGNPETKPDLEPAFEEFVLGHSNELESVMSSRSTQTNEVGRCSWFLFPFSLIEKEFTTLARVDVGSSAGLTLLLPTIAFDVRPGRVIGDIGELVVRCDARGPVPEIEHVPRVVWSVGFDSTPIDLFDDEEIQWLEACVWPEQVDRFDRLVSAIDLARRQGIRVERGDAVADVAGFVDRASEHGHPVVTTSWVLNYLTAEQRVSFVDQLDEIGSARDLSWVIAESPRETPELPVNGHEDITVISLVTWRQGKREARRLATAHPHGQWINWSS